MRIATLTLAVLSVSSIVSSAPLPDNVRRLTSSETAEQHVEKLEKRNPWDWSKFSPSNIFSRPFKGSKVTDPKLDDMKLEDSKLENLKLDDSKLETQPLLSSLKKETSDALYPPPKKTSWLASGLFQRKPKPPTQAPLKELTQDELDALAKAKAYADRKQRNLAIGGAMVAALGIGGVITWAALGDKAYRRCLREPTRKGCEKYFVVTTNNKPAGDVGKKPDGEDKQNDKTK